MVSGKASTKYSVSESALSANPLTRRQRIKRDKWLYLLLIPGLLYFIVFKYFPMWGVAIAFQNYSPFLGVLGSQWVGFEHFSNFFSNPDFFDCSEIRLFWPSMI